MKLSSKTKYGIRACHLLGSVYGKETMSATDLEKRIGVSSKYIEQIMRLLIKRDIITASRGANGGYTLKFPPKDISIGQIVRALEDDIEIIECVSKDGKCKCCPSSKVWKKLYNGINELLDSMSLEQMIKGEID